MDNQAPITNTFSLKILLAVLVLGMLLSLPAFGQETPPQSALGVSPAIFELVLGPEEEKTETLQVFNITNFPLPIKGSVKNFTPKEEIPEEAKKIFDASSWITIEPADFILQPNQYKEITVTVLPPEEAEPGGHYATIYFQPLLPVEVLSPQTAYVAARIGVLTFLVVKGEITEKVSLASFTGPSLKQFGPVNFRLMLKNEGNVHLLPSGEVVIWNWQNKEVTKIPLTPSQVLPQTIKEFSFVWPKKYLLGRFLAQAQLIYGSEQQKIASEKITFWVVPWVPITILISVLTLVVLSFILIRKRVVLVVRVLLGQVEVRKVTARNEKRYPQRFFPPKGGEKKSMKSAKKLSRILALGTILALALGNFSWIPQARAATLTGASVALSDARASGTTVSYSIEFSGITTSAIKCIKVVFSTAATGGSTPTGLSTTSAAYSAAGSDYVPDVETWTADGTTTPGTVVITNANGETPASATDGTVVITGMTNGSTAETGYFAQFSTWTADNCTGALDSGTGVFIYTTGQAVSLTVDPTISFGIALVGSSESVNGATTTVATTDGTIPFSTVDYQANAVAAHDITTTTNAGSGYTVYIRYTAAPSDGGSETIDDVSPGTNASPQNFSAAGVEAFGYTTNDSSLSATGDGADRFTNPANQWAKFTTGNLEVAYNASEIATDVVRIGYQVGVHSTTAAATYTSTVIITCTPQY